MAHPAALTDKRLGLTDDLSGKLTSGRVVEGNDAPEVSP
jgi:hypothetical protein